MTRASAALLVALATVACRKAPPPAPRAVDYDVTLDARDDCLHHATALVSLGADGVLLFGACGHTSEGERGEEIVGARLDPRGRAGTIEPVEVLDSGWATNLVAAPIKNGGALLGWTAAVSRHASAYVEPVDEQSRPTGEPTAIGPGRAAALASGPQGGALALVTEPDVLSDDDPTAGIALEIVILDAGAAIVGRQNISHRVEAARPQVALAGDADGYALVWSEAGVLTATHTDASGTISARGAIVPDPSTLQLPVGTRFSSPSLVLTAQHAHVAALVELPGGSSEIWLGTGTIGARERDWHWARIVASSSSRRSGLSLSRSPDGSFLAWSESAGEFSAIHTLRLDPNGAPIGPPSVAILAAILFDGPVAALAGIVAAAQPPANGATGALRVVQRVSAK